jgi:hypothetical protein
MRPKTRGELEIELAVATVLEEQNRFLVPAWAYAVEAQITEVLKRVLALATNRDAYTTQEIEEACMELRTVVNSALEGVMMAVRKYKGEVE